MFVIHKIIISCLAATLLVPGNCTNPSGNMKTIPQRGFRYIDLPEVSYNSSVSIEEALLNRRSVRDFSPQPLTLDQISQLLWAAYGITEKGTNPGGLRTAPSAGAIYPLEIYVVAGNIEGLSAGLYQYDATQHRLEFLREGELRRDLAEAALSQGFIADAPAMLIYTAVYKRITEKYGERGKERYVSAGLGHSAENVYLQAVSLGLGTCAVGAFTDKMVSNTLMLSPDETPLYIMPIGKPR